MIVGVGVDIIEISRIRNAVEQRGKAFLDRIFTQEEQNYCMSRSKDSKVYESFAARFAAKEAVFKALGVRKKGIRWQDIEVVVDAEGCPVGVLRGVFLECSRELGVDGVRLSLSHSREYAVAIAIMTASSASEGTGLEILR